MPLSFLSLIMASSKLYYLQRFGIFSDPNPSLLMVIPFLPFHFFLLLGNIFILCLLATYFKAGVLVFIALTMLLQTILGLLTFRNNGEEKKIYQYFYRNQETYAKAEIAHMFNIFLSTSWLSPCTVWVNNKLLNPKFLIKSALVSFVINCIALTILFFTEEIAISYFDSNPPIFHCFPKYGAQNFIPSYKHFSGHTLTDFISISESEETMLSKIRICSSDEQSNDFFLKYILPFGFGVFVLSLLSAFILQSLSSYKTLYSVLCMLENPKLFQHFFNEFLTEFISYKPNEKSSRATKKSESTVGKGSPPKTKMDKFKRDIAISTKILGNNKDAELKANAISCFETMQENAWFVKGTRGFYQLKQALKLNFSNRIYEKKIWGENPPLQKALELHNIGLWCFLILLGGEGAAANDYSQSNVELLSVIDSSDTNAFTKWLFDKAMMRYGEEAVINAVAANDVVNLEILLENDYNVDLPDSDGVTPLQRAVDYGYIESLMVLIFYNAKINAKLKDGQTVLHFAAINGKLKSLEILIDNHADINDKDRDGKTALHHAAEKGHLEILNLLINNEAKVDAEDNDSRTPIFFAVKEGWTDCLESLVKANANICDKDNGKRTPLHLAAEQGKTKMLNTLIKKLENKHSDEDEKAVKDAVNAPDIENQTPVHLAARAGESECLQILLDCEANINAKGKKGQTPLHQAAKNGYVGCLKKLLKNKQTQSNATDDKGNTPLHLAAKEGESKVLEYLLFNEMSFIKINPRNKNGETPLHLAAKVGDSDCVEILLGGGAKPNAADIKKQTPLHFAAMSGSVVCMEMLIDWGAEIGIKNTNEETPMHVAASKGKSDCLELLTLINASLVKEKNKTGHTPLHLAAENGQLDCLKILIENGADAHALNEERQTPFHLAPKGGNLDILNHLIETEDKSLIHAKDETGRMPIHFAAMEGKADFLAILIEKGAKVNAVDKKGKTPLHCAVKKGKRDAVKLLIDNKADFNAKDKFEKLPADYIKENRGEILPLFK